VYREHVEWTRYFLEVKTEEILKHKDEDKTPRLVNMDLYSPFFAGKRLLQEERLSPQSIGRGSH
jgi:hypothetical protein